MRLNPKVRSEKPTGRSGGARAGRMVWGMFEVSSVEGQVPRRPDARKKGSQVPFWQVWVLTLKLLVIRSLYFVCASISQ